MCSTSYIHHTLDLIDNFVRLQFPTASKWTLQSTHDLAQALLVTWIARICPARFVTMLDSTPFRIYEGKYSRIITSHVLERTLSNRLKEDAGSAALCIKRPLCFPRWSLILRSPFAYFKMCPSRFLRTETSWRFIHLLVGSKNPYSDIELNSGRSSRKYYLRIWLFRCSYH